jgi:hypothetical protein
MREKVDKGHPVYFKGRNRRLFGIEGSQKVLSRAVDIEGVSGGKVNILGGHSIGDSKQK